MMDHARHLSSPSPTSPFLFHHSERPFKSSSNPLTPLLSSTVVADVTSVEDCFSTTSSSISHQNQNPFGVDHHHHHQHHHSLVDNHHHNHHLQSNHHHHHHHHHNRHNDQCVIDQDSLTGVDDDDDDGMHNMLSGSSTSSTSTMPLLTESHSHHSFSRISLEEYSPLSLVEDCDNALPISPTSLACGSHHSFKTSLNGLKMDNLVGDHDDHEVHDDVSDAHSLSPSLLSTSASNHHNLWSTSSTAITQNTSLLNSTSTSFLLSHHHHHHHQLNSLIQQLEPQSLDEPPSLLNNGSNFDTSTSLAVNRPSSEPPPGCGVETPDVETKSLNSQPLQPKSKQTNVKSGKDSAGSTPPLLPSPGRPRKSRNRSGGCVAKQSPVTNVVDSNKNVGSDKKSPKHMPFSAIAGSSTINQQDTTNSSKLHLQLNHHKKLQELQQRLFGGKPTLDIETTSGTGSTTDTLPAIESKKFQADNNLSSSSRTHSSGTTACKQVRSIKEEPDSSAGNKDDAASSCQVSSVKIRNRPLRNRRNRGHKTEVTSCNPSSSTPQSGGTKTTSKSVTTETAEPDTTTKSSDCIKLVDLLSGNSSDTKNNNGFLVNGFTPPLETNDSDNGVIGEKRMQQIQLQVSPSLTVLANGGLMQPIGIQQHQQQQQSNGTVIASSGTFSNQILCRPQTIVATTGGQLKGIMSNNELLKSGETMLTNWSIQTNGGGLNNQNIINNNNSNNIGNNSNSNANISNGQPIGAHQIAIQVICQDGTSLVLPVSSAAGLNAAVSLTSQHQQLQAVLANNANQQRNSNQLLPLMSVSNIVAQHQVNSVENGTNNTSSNQSNRNSNSAPQATGLAASSPTLAALLDAGTNRNNSNNDLNNGNFSSQNFVPTNLLRKLVSGNSTAELKRGELTLQAGSNLSLGNCGSLVTVCAPSNTNSSFQTTKHVNLVTNGGGGSLEKRIKFENVDANNNHTTTITSNNNSNNMQTTFTLIDPHGIIVSQNGNNDKAAKQGAPQASNGNVGVATQQHNVIKANLDSTKQNKICSSTGNRQVDPTQPFRCEHCNSTFTRLGNFTRHKKIHTIPTKDGQRFKCDVCSKSFLQRCDLARHLHIHRGTEPHRCNICGKGYIRHSDLVTHQRFHNKEKPFGCPHCSKGFCQRGDLNRHLRSIHLQMKPILCPCCNRKFAKQETLLRHLNTAHRSKPSITTANAVKAELPPNYTITQGEDKQTTISVVTNAAVLNTNIAQKNVPVASLQAIQATLCRVPQSLDQCTNSGSKTVSSSKQDSSVKTVA